MAKILIVDDEPKMTSLICGHLEDAGYKIDTTTQPKEGLEMIAKNSYDIVITDLSMPEISGMDILEKAIEANSDVIMMTAFGSVDTAVKAMKKGASDYILKPFSLDELELIVNRIIKNQQKESLSKHYEQIANSSTAHDFIGQSKAAAAVKQLIKKVAPTDATVLLTGRSGSGKEVAARMLHDYSQRCDKPFIAVNCAALTETLLESELFGHEKGAFTGAVSRKRGRFELAEGGTIFLDEIAETSNSLQSKLLRVLEERKLTRVGGVTTIDINVRVVAATNRNLKEEILNGGFREDLYFRLNVFPIEVPSLADRVDDIVPLAEHFLEKQRYPHRQLTSEIAELLKRYDWPGNIRELKNVIERAIILAGGEPLSRADFTLDIDDNPLVPLASSGDGGLEQNEKEMIIQALEQASGNKTEAAKLLKITRRRLYSRMKYHNLDL